jgi:two-component system, OmpR family, response regulator
MQAPKRLLHVDDDDRFRTLVDKMLSSMGFAVESVGDPTTVTERLAENDWDLVITDLMMPGLDGLALLRQLRGNGYAGPALVLSSKSLRREERLELQDLNARFLVKPCGPRVLLERVRQCLSKS